VAVGALLGAIAGAALAAYVERFWTAASTREDEAELLRRLDKLEAEIEELELQRRARRHKSETTIPAGPAQTSQPTQSSHSAMSS
jgi:hypothetical protein